MNGAEVSEWIAPTALVVFMAREAFDHFKGRSRAALDQISQMRRELDVISVHIENFKATLAITQKTAADLNVAFERLRQLESQAQVGSAHRGSNA